MGKLDRIVMHRTVPQRPHISRDLSIKVSKTDPVAVGSVVTGSDEDWLDQEYLGRLKPKVFPELLYRDVGHHVFEKSDDGIVQLQPNLGLEGNSGLLFELEPFGKISCKLSGHHLGVGVEDVAFFRFIRDVSFDLVDQAVVGGRLKLGVQVSGLLVVGGFVFRIHKVKTDHTRVALLSGNTA